MMRRRGGLQGTATSVLLGLCCTACHGWQSVTTPAGPQASRLDGLFWIFTAICAAIWVLVLLVLAGAMMRKRPAGAPFPSERSEKCASVVVGGAVAVSALVIVGLTLFSYLATHGLASGTADPLVIRVRGYQWWWEVTYVDAAADRSFLTANEIHLPVGRPVRIELAAPDVIHSFWAPNLMGKQDLIPGRDNAITFIADRPGVYREQCAEFCGLQHAHMAMLIVAESPTSFAAWRANQLADAVASAGAVQEEGGRVFAAKACASCHTIRGTSASGTLGPDLTHVGSRQTIAAGMLPTTRGSLAAWIADPQTIKPGNNMPMVSLSGSELNAVSAYLAALK
jgi:cytochrome c oxidase subunit II